MRRSTAAGAAIAALVVVAAGIGWLLWTSETETRAMDRSNVSSDLGTLTKLIHLPLTPRAVRWQVLNPARGKSGLGPSDWALVVVMSLDAEQADQLASGAIAVNGRSKLLDPYYEQVLSADLKKDTAAIIADGSNLQWRSADAFFRQPLLNGFFVLSKPAGKLILVLATS